MQQYIALLRGINVGGKNKIAMSALKDMFESQGFKAVRTYINSGNVVFESDEKDLSWLRDQLEQEVEAVFSLRIRIVVLVGYDLVEALDYAHAIWGVDPDYIHNAVFMIPPFQVGELMDTLGYFNVEYDIISYYKNIIFWSTKREHYNRSKYAKMAGLSVYRHVTIRNANTTRKLKGMIEGIEI